MERVLITGAGSGFGLGASLELARRGYDVIATTEIVSQITAVTAAAAEPFVKVGDRVRKGQIVCIIEAMKLMNEIEADIEGTIVEIYAENAKPVEYGQKLFAILPVS